MRGGLPIFGFPPPPMPAEPPPPPEDEPKRDVLEAEDEKLLHWRIAHLEGIGLPYPLALQLALVGADWHRVARAMERGMTVDQVEAVFL